jgi:hypothetical protein
VIAPLKDAADAAERQLAEEAGVPVPSPAQAAALVGSSAPAPASGGGGLASLFKGVFALVATLVLLSCCCFAGLLGRSPSEITGKVTRVAWERSIDVEALTAVHQQQWGQAPEGARDVTHQRAQSGTKQVQTGTKTVYTKEKYQSGTHTVTTQERVQQGTKTVYKKEKVKVGSHKVVTGHKDLGNGFFEDVTKDVPDYEMRDVPHEEPNYVMRDVDHQEPTYSWRDVPHQEPVYRDEPVYGELYSFTVDVWQPERTPKASGTSEAPRWPDLGLGAKEREGARHEDYTVWFSVADSPGEPSARVGASDFAKYAPGTSWRLSSSQGEVSVLGAPGDGHGR